MDNRKFEKKKISEINNFLSYYEKIFLQERNKNKEKLFEQIKEIKNANEKQLVNFDESKDMQQEKEKEKEKDIALNSQFCNFENQLDILSDWIIL